MKHPSARALHAYWDRLRADRAAPERSEIDPAKIGRLLGDIFLLENSANERFSVRLAGTRLCALLGQEIRGRSLVEIFAQEDKPALSGLLDGVADDASPAIAGVEGETADGRKIALELIALPLRHRGLTHARMLGALLPLDVPFWVGTVPVATLRLKSMRMLDTDSSDPSRFADAKRSLFGRLRVVQGGLN